MHRKTKYKWIFLRRKKLTCNKILALLLLNSCFLQSIHNHVSLPIYLILSTFPYFKYSLSRRAYNESRSADKNKYSLLSN